MPQGVYSKIKCKAGISTSFKLLPHQQKNLDYFLESKYKGLLLYHKLGSGKTCTAISIANKMLEKNLVRHIYVFTPGSLRANFINEYCKKCGMNRDYIRDKYTFITYNFAVSKYVPKLDNSLVIIDEVHNLINGYRNESEHPYNIYMKIYNANCRVLALSGTPIYNYNEESGALFGLLKPEINFTEFYQNFQEKEDGTFVVKNQTKLKRALEGIISYYPGSEKDMPKIIEHPPIKCIMSVEQSKQYLEVMEQESKLQNPPKKSLKYTNPKRYKLLEGLHVMALKNMLTRRVSNFYYPLKYFNYIEEANEMSDFHLFEKKDENKEIEKKDENKELEKPLKFKDLLKDEGGWIEKDIFTNRGILKYSPKISAFLYNLIYHINEKHVLFTTFKEKGGVYLISSILKMCGIKSLIFSGDSSDSERLGILRKFNNENNIDGSKYKILLITEAGAEGISVMETTHMHILESNPRINKIIQSIGRTARYGSHKRLPKEKRVINVWSYWSVWPNSDINNKVEIYNREGNIVMQNLKGTANMKIIDETLYLKGEKTKRRINSFLDIIQKQSI